MDRFQSPVGHKFDRNLYRVAPLLGGGYVSQVLAQRGRNQIVLPAAAPQLTVHSWTYLYLPTSTNRYLLVCFMRLYFVPNWVNIPSRGFRETFSGIGKAIREICPAVAPMDRSLAHHVPTVRALCIGHGVRWGEGQVSTITSHLPPPPTCTQQIEPGENLGFPVPRPAPPEPGSNSGQTTCLCMCPIPNFSSPALLASY